jgi:hypothetical protein
MKPDTTKQYPFTGEYYGYTLVTSEDQTVSERVYNTFFTKVDLALTVSFIGDLSLESQTKMQIDGVVRNIRDAHDQEIYENGVWTITRTMPVINALHLKDGYAYSATIISGDI